MNHLDKIKKIILVTMLSLMTIGVVFAAENIEEGIEETTIGTEDDRNNTLDEKKIYIVTNRENETKLAVNSDGKILVKTTQGSHHSDYEDDNLTLIYDQKTNKPGLIYNYTTGEEAKKETTYETYMSDDGSEYTEEYSWWRRIRLNYYYDLDGKKYEKVDREDRIDYLYNGYGLLKPYDDYDNEYGRIYDFKKEEYKKYDVDIMRLFKMDDKLYGSNNKEYYYNDKNTRYYLFDDEMNLIKNMTYEEWSESNGKEIDKWVGSGVDGGFYAHIGIKGDKRYILNKDNKIISKAYKCSDIKVRNKYGKVEDSIFTRREEDKIIYFTLKGDIFTIPFDQDVWDGHNYYNRLTTIKDKGVLVGNGAYYAIPKDPAHIASSSESYIYKASESTAFATIQTYITSDDMSDIPAGVQFFLEDLYLYDNTILARYTDPEIGSLWSYKNLETNEYFLCRDILNKKNIDEMERPIALVIINREPLIKAYDVKTGELVKTFNRTYDPDRCMTMRKYKNRKLYFLKKADSKYEGYAYAYDIYDKDLNLIKSNVQDAALGTDPEDSLIFEKYTILKDFPRNEKKMIENYCYVLDDNNKEIIKRKTDEYEVHTLKFGEKTIIKVKNKKDETEMLYDEKGKTIFSNDKIKEVEIYDDYLIISDEEKTYIYDKNYKLFKTFDFPTKTVSKIYKWDGVWNNEVNTNFPIILELTNGLETLLDKDFNIVGDNYKYIEAHEDYFIYQDDFKIYIQNLDGTTIYVTNVFNGFNEEDYNKNEYKY